MPRPKRINLGGTRNIIWQEQVNPQNSLKRGVSFCDVEWTNDAAAKLGLESTLRMRGIGRDGWVACAAHSPYSSS